VEDIGSWDDFPCFRIAFAWGFHRVSATGMTVVGPCVRRESTGLEYTPTCLSFTGRANYEEESKRWMELNNKPGLLEEAPWTEKAIKALIAKRDREKNKSDCCITNAVTLERMGYE
jgi:hypothetical protein